MCSQASVLRFSCREPDQLPCIARVGGLLHVLVKAPGASLQNKSDSIVSPSSSLLRIVIRSTGIPHRYLLAPGVSFPHSSSSLKKVCGSPGAYQGTRLPLSFRNAQHGLMPPLASWVGPGESR